MSKILKATFAIATIPIIGSVVMHVAPEWMRTAFFITFYIIFCGAIIAAIAKAEID